MSVRTDRVNLEIVINGNQGQRELGEMEQKARKLRASIKEATSNEKELRNQRNQVSKNSDQWRKLDAQVKAVREEKGKLRQELGATKDRMAQLRKEVGINGLTLRQLGKRARELRANMSNITPGTEHFRKTKAELDQVNARIKKLRGTTSQVGRAWESVKKQIRAFGVIALASLGGQALFNGIDRLIDRNAKLSDSISDVQKTTGLTKLEVEDLMQSFRYFNTRSSRSELLGLARIAGKLGFEGKKNIEAFVQQADQINVALSEDLGGNVEETIRQLGKINDLFRITEELGAAEALKKTGSAINVLGANSSANEAELVDFTKRVGGVAPQANISLTEILGLASAIDQLGQSPETASTVFAQLIPDMFKETATFAKVAGKSTKEFSDILAKDTNEALLLVLEGLNGNSDGYQMMVNKLDSLGLEGKRSINVLGALASKTSLIRGEQEKANEAFDEGTSLSDEFALKNENLAGSWARLSKRIKAAFVNSDLIKGMARVIGSLDRMTAPKKSDMLEKQRFKLLNMADQLKRTTISEAERLKVINKLKEEYPTLLGNLDAETSKNEEVFSAVNKANFALSKRISLMKMQEEISNLAFKKSNFEDDLRESREAALELMQRVASQRGIALPQTFEDDIDRLKQFNRQLSQLAQVNQRTGATHDSDYSSLSNYLVAINNAQRGLEDVDQQMTILIDKENAFAEKFKDLLGFNQEESGDGENNQDDPVVSAPIKAAQDITSFLEQEQEKRLLNQLSGYDKERQALMNHFKDKIELAKGNFELEAALIQERESQLETLDENYRADYLKRREDLQQELHLLGLNDKQREIEIAKDKWNTLIGQLEQHGLDTTAAHELMQNEIEAIIKSSAENQSVILSSAFSDFATIIGATSDFIASTLSETAKEQASFIRFQQTLTAIEVTLNQISAISNAIKNASKTSLTPLGLAAKIATSTSLIIAAFAPLTKKLDGANNVPSFYTGGFTGSGLGFDDAQGNQVAGIVHSNEYVVNSQLLQIPQFADMVGLMEAVRLNQTSAPVASTSASQNPVSGSTQGLELLRQEIVKLREALFERPNLVVIGDSSIVDLKDRLEEFEQFEKSVKK